MIATGFEIALTPAGIELSQCRGDFLSLCSHNAYILKNDILYSI